MFSSGVRAADQGPRPRKPRLALGSYCCTVPSFCLLFRNGSTAGGRRRNVTVTVTVMVTVMAMGDTLSGRTTTVAVGGGGGVVASDEQGGQRHLSSQAISRHLATSSSCR